MTALGPSAFIDEEISERGTEVDPHSPLGSHVGTDCWWCHRYQPPVLPALSKPYQVREVAAREVFDHLLAIPPQLPVVIGEPVHG